MELAQRRSKSTTFLFLAIEYVLGIEYRSLAAEWPARVLVSEAPDRAG